MKTDHTKDPVGKHFKGAYLTSSEKQLINEWLRDLAYMSISINSNKEIKWILSRSGYSPKQKGEKIFSLLRRIRYPQLTSWEEHFKKESGKLLRITGCRFSACPYFEGNELTVSFSFGSKNAGNMQSVIKNIRRNIREIGRLIPPYNIRVTGIK